jgi:fumarate hydratase class I
LCLAQDCIRKVTAPEYPELGMEAAWRIEVESVPAFIVVDDKRNDVFNELDLRWRLPRGSVRPASA